MKGFLAYMDEPLVSTDFVNSTYSSIFDALSTFSIGGNMVEGTGMVRQRIRLLRSDG